MSAFLTKSMARNIFYGGTLFSVLLFLALTFHTTWKLPQRDHRENLTPEVVRGKHLWETRNCIGCHTILGEGAYFAPELANVMTRWGVADDPQGAFDALKGWMDSMPSGIEGRRQMPQFHFTEQQLDDLVAFLKWTSEIDTENWPPNIEG